jgi:hypothetical protein
VACLVGNEGVEIVEQRALKTNVDRFAVDPRATRAALPLHFAALKITD